MYSYIYMQYGGIKVFQPPQTVAIDAIKEFSDGMEELCQELEGSEELMKDEVVGNFVAWHREHNIRGDRT